MTENEFYELRLHDELETDAMFNQFSRSFGEILFVVCIASTFISKLAAS
jgi:hypothetical protein